jgi:hypothetical protein
MAPRTTKHATTRTKAGEGRRFQPGESGNPSGRPAGVRTLAAPHVGAALEALVDLARQRDDPAAAVAAAQAILDAARLVRG